MSASERSWPTSDGVELAVFVPDFSFDAAEAILTADAGRVIPSLVDHSLLALNGDRYRMLEVVRRGDEPPRSCGRPGPGPPPCPVVRRADRVTGARHHRDRGLEARSKTSGRRPEPPGRHRLVRVQRRARSSVRHRRTACSNGSPTTGAPDHHGLRRVQGPPQLFRSAMALVWSTKNGGGSRTISAAISWHTAARSPWRS